mgnify:CR=1 FL=1
MSILSTYTVSLPNGSQGSVMDFYTAIMDGSVEATDEGYILPDGSVLPTEGEAIYGPTEDELLALLSPYIYQEPSPSRDIPRNELEEMERTLTIDAPTKKARLSNPLKIILVLISVMLLRDNKGLKV